MTRASERPAVHDESRRVRETRLEVMLRRRPRLHVLWALLAGVALSCSAKTPGHPAGGAGAPGSSAGMGGGGLAAAGGSGGVAGQPSSGASGASASGGAPGAGEDASAGAGGANGASDADAPTASPGDAPPSVGTGCKGAVVCYDFEDCALPKGWTVPTFGEGSQGGGSTLVDDVRPHSGKCALHMKDFSGGSPQHAYLADLPAGFGPVMWGRAWIYTTSAPSMHGALIKARYSLPGSNALDWYEVGYEYKNYNGHWHNPLPPSGLPEWILRSTTSIAVNQWQCVEWLWDTDNGGMAQAADPRMWVDGAELVFGPGIQYDGTNTKPQRPTTPRGTSFVSLEVGLTMYHPVDETMNVFFDELAFGKERVGCNP
jgi:hypothetical protein